MIVGFIPARGGSKRLPRKNIRIFAGKPLLAHTIAQALAARCMDRCLVSTDDDEIAGIATRHGAEVVWRPAALATDVSPTGAAAQHVLSELAGQDVEAIVTLQPNCPLRPAGIVDTAVALFRAEAPDSVVSVTRSAEKGGLIVEGLFTPDYRPGTRSQDMPERYYENGVIYVSRASMVRERADLFGARITPLVLDSFYARGDIDTALDFAVAEFLFDRCKDHVPQGLESPGGLA